MADIIQMELERDNLHEKFGGGVPTHSIVVLQGEDGTGKSIVAQRLTYGFLQWSHKVTYISTELDTTSFVRQMESVDYNIVDNLLNGDLLFISMIPSLGNVKLRDDFLDKLMRAKRLYDSDIIIFDALSSLIVKQSMQSGKAFELIRFFKLLNNIGKTIILTVDTHNFNEILLQVLHSMSDVYIKLEAKMNLGELIRVINIIRYKRCKSVVGSSIPYNVEPKIGVKIVLTSLA